MRAISRAAALIAVVDIDGCNAGAVLVTFPCGAEESVLVRFIQNGNGAASTAHTLVSSDFGDVEQY